jgi:hypothetical protein
MAEWLTYPQVGERLNISTEAARQRALRGHWQRRMDNHGHALVTIPEGVTTRPRRSNKRSNDRPKQEQEAALLIEALRDHIETLKADLALARDQAAQAIEAHQRLAVKLAKLKARRKKR